MDYVVDMQGFQSPENVFVCKELAYSRLDVNSISDVTFFKPPYHWIQLPLEYRHLNKWIEMRHHGIEWTSGGHPQMSYKYLPTILENYLGDSRNIYVKGMEKKQLLQKTFLDKKIIDVETEMRCPPLKNLTLEFPTNCSYHNKRSSEFTCALKNVHKLTIWLNERKKQTEARGIDTVDGLICECNLYKNYVEYFESAMATTNHRKSVSYSMYNKIRNKL